MADVITRRAQVSVAEDDTGEATASCVAGEVAVGGGAGYDGPGDGQVAILLDEPLEPDGSAPEGGDAATQWRAFANNITGSGGTKVIHVYVLCTTP